MHFSRTHRQILALALWRAITHQSRNGGIISVFLSSLVRVGPIASALVIPVPQYGPAALYGSDCCLTSLLAPCSMIGSGSEVRTHQRRIVFQVQFLIT